MSTKKVTTEESLVATRKTTRISVDLVTQQHHYLKLFSMEHTVRASTVLRALLYHLETDEAWAEKIADDLQKHE